MGNMRNHRLSTRTILSRAKTKSPIKLKNIAQENKFNLFFAAVLSVLQESGALSIDEPPLTEAPKPTVPTDNLPAGIAVGTVLTLATLIGFALCIWFHYRRCKRPYNFSNAPDIDLHQPETNTFRQFSLRKLSSIFVKKKSTTNTQELTEIPPQNSKDERKTTLNNTV